MTTEKKTLTIMRTVRLICPCGEEMRRISGGDPKSRPPKFAHQCPACKRREITDKQYPYLEYEERPEEIDMADFEYRVMQVLSRRDKKVLKMAKSVIEDEG